MNASGRTRRWPIILWFLLWSGVFQMPGFGGAEDGESLGGPPSREPVPWVAVRPVEIDEVLYNPGMGFADFHFGFGHPPTTDQYPRSTVAYFRWSWADLEPAEGQYAFEFVDRIIEQAKAKGERLAFRIVAEYEQGSPRWLLEKGVASIKETDGIFPDYNNPLFLEYHEKLIKAFGERYGASPDIDHVDIGSVGCWGEWNTACCLPEHLPQCQTFFPSEANQIRITDWYIHYFPQVPLVSLHSGLLKYGAERGAGWRGDCFGDYGYFTPTWNHMEHAYAPVLRDSVIGDAWKRGPVQFEVCGVMQDWYDKGFDIDRILQQGLDWHVSVLNAKSAPVPKVWRSKVEQFLKKMGYRLVLREFSHQAEAGAGSPFELQSRWENVGVAPVYRPWPLAYRLRNESEQVVAQWTSKADLRRWLPGERYQVEDATTLPEQLPAGRYQIEVAVLDETGRAPLVDLAIAGRRVDRWYPVSAVTLR
ncbi:MAG: DUF4832 domain-containing protein [Nitrospiraceae bacterium]